MMVRLPEAVAWGARMNAGLSVYRPGAVMVLKADAVLYPDGGVRVVPSRAATPRPAQARTAEVARLGFGGGLPRWMRAT